MDKIPDEIKDKIWENFTDYCTIYLATVDGDKPRIRPMTLVLLDSRFWLLTGTNDAKTTQIIENPKIEICYPIETDENKGYVRFNGRAKIILDKIIKVDIAKRVDYFNDHWKGPEDPNYTLIEAEFEEIEYMEPGKYLADKFRL